MQLRHHQNSSGKPWSGTGRTRLRLPAPVWTLVGVAVYALYRPHGPLAAGAIAAGGYELTPLKRHFRRRCRHSVRSGLEFGLCCVGSSIGLMGMLVAVGVMSVTWMSVIAALALAQKLLPPNSPSTCRWRWRSLDLAS